VRDVAAGYATAVHLEQTLPVSPDAPRLARAVFTEALPGRLSAQRVEDALVVASEFAQIAASRGGVSFLMTVDVAGDRLRFTFHDVPGPSAAIASDLEPISRRIVDSMCDRWGAFDTRDGADLWFELSG
jgi:hypothetical protein